MPCAWAAQSPAIGHMRHDGRFGVQTVAPRSISAWAQSPDRAPHAKVCARRLSCAFAAGNGCLTANSRAITRSMLPSTGMVEAPKAMAAMAAAV